MENIKRTIKDMLKKTSYSVSDDCKDMLNYAEKIEKKAASKQLLKTICKNIETAERDKKTMCQSPGYGTIYIKFGPNIKMFDFESIIQESLVELTEENFFRPSIVDPLTRKNNGDNSGHRAPNIEYRFEKNLNHIEIIASFKGCGVEVFNKMKVFTYAEMGEKFSGIRKFILETVCEAGGKPCLPTAIGIGIGGQIDVAAKLSREAVSLRSWKERNKEDYIADLEKELLNEINQLNIGCGGMTGDISALAVNIETAATHTAICPVVINFHCWAARRAGVKIFEDGSTENISFC